MEIYKFGGASVKDASGVKNVFDIVKEAEGKLVVVISAMGKTTDMLEKICRSYFSGKDWERDYRALRSFHENIVRELFGEGPHRAGRRIKEVSDALYEDLRGTPSMSYDYEYDRIVSYGERLSSLILYLYMEYRGLRVRWTDIRKYMLTDDNYRDANVNTEVAGKLCREVFSFENESVYITQGFIGGTFTGQTTTLGREGSDYTAALLANFLNAEALTIWKDVPGIMNADPKLHPEARILEKLSYKEAIELAHFGAKVIHPKTIKPLENKGIPLYVKSFFSPDGSGSLICDITGDLKYPPIYIDKGNQLLLTLTPRDFSFIAEEKLSLIFSVLAKYRLRLNLMQNAAISFTFCIDNDISLMDSFMEELRPDFELLYNTDVRLLTVRHYNEEILSKLVAGAICLVEQRSRSTARFVLSGT